MMTTLLALAIATGNRPPAPRTAAPAPSATITNAPSRDPSQWGMQGTAVPGPGALACIGFVRLLSRRTLRR